MKTIFIDLDHTLIKPKSGNTFPVDIEDWQFVEGVPEKLHEFYNMGYIIIIVSNQAGIFYNYITEDDFKKKINDIQLKLFKNYNVDIEEVYYCKDDISFYRKPNPGMAFKACLEFDIIPRYCIMVGDMDTDKQFAENAGIGTYHHVEAFKNLTLNK